MLSDISKEISFFKHLQEYKVKYLLIGRQACILYGLPVYTFDYDIAIDNSLENIEKLLKIAEELKVFPSKQIEKIKAKKAPIFSLQDDIKIDVFCAKKYVTKDGEVLEFAKAFARRKQKHDKKYKITFYLPTIDDLILFKKINPSQRDLEDIKALEIIKEKS